ncbi:MAG: DNA polymerase III subunit delta' [Beijerinckiaceae bacterium]|nr:DNA polymerase III subunit delta' [Beijerinckiaceae bacterium]
MASRHTESGPESDRFKDAPHPRETYGFFGHSGAERELLLSYLSGRLPHAIILGGPPGIGKATLAWRFARFLLANPHPAVGPRATKIDLFVPDSHIAARQAATLAHPDLVLLRREWNLETKKHFTQIQVDDVRRAIHMFQLAAGRGGFRICIIDCADDLNPSSANALLKLVEEPPPHSLFLIIAHRPGRLLPTLRSRCRTVQLKPLESADIGNILSTLGPPWSEASGPGRENAIARAHGSVHGALRLLDDGGMTLEADVGQVLDDLPRISWKKVHALADRIAARNTSNDYECALDAIDEWLDSRVRLGARDFGEDCAHRLAHYAEVWEKLAQAARETETFNLDRRPLVLSLIADLAAAARVSSS